VSARGRGPDESDDYSVLVELGCADRVVALVRDEHPADEYMTRLGWQAGVARRVADDLDGAVVDKLLDRLEDGVDGDALTPSCSAGGADRLAH
jgi:hypothetical protein